MKRLLPVDLYMNYLYPLSDFASLLDTSLILYHHDVATYCTYHAPPYHLCSLPMLSIPLHPASSAEPSSAKPEFKEEPIKVWSLSGTCSEVSEQASQWVSAFLNADKTDIGPFGEADPASTPDKRYRLMRMKTPLLPGKHPKAHISGMFDGDEKMSFLDENQVLVANASSLARLNTELAARGVSRVLMEQFRPSIVVTGTDAWDEDR